jgi:hypothetical protein
MRGCYFFLGWQLRDARSELKMSHVKTGSRIVLVIILFFLAALPQVQAQGTGDLDNQKWRVEGNWWFTHPDGYFGLNGSNNYVNFNRDFGLGNFSTFSGGIDYRFGHKHHFLFNVTPIDESRTVTLARTIMFQGETYDVGAQVNASLRTWDFAPGYEYDIIRRDHGFLGLEVDVNLVDTRAALSVVGTGGGSASGSKSLFAPLPAIGPVFRWYPLHDSNRLSIDGSVRGMPFFGYGNFLSARGGLNVGLTKNLMFRAGYQMGSRLSIHGTSDQIAIKLTHSGPTAGLEYSFGEAPPPREKVPNQPSYWHVNWIPAYLWFTGLQGSVGAAGQVVPVDAGFSDIFNQLNIGYMTTLDVRRKRIGLLTDLIFISLSSDQQSTPVGTLYSGFTANAKQFIIDPELYVRLLDKDRGTVDIVGGARFWNLNNSIDLLAGSQPPTAVGQTQFWVDPVVGARFRLNLDKGFFVDLKGDAGGFGVGSKVTYQIYGGLGKQIKKRFSLMLGYRYLDVDYQSGGFTYDVHMNGLLAGFGIRFK